MDTKKIKLSKWEDKKTCDFLDHDEIVRYYVKNGTRNIVSYIIKSNKHRKAAIFDDKFNNNPLYLYDDNLNILKLKVDILLNEYGYSVTKFGF